MQSTTRTSKIISGGQTGVEIGALQGVLEHNRKKETSHKISTGGSMMRNFMTEKRSSPQYAHIFGLTDCDSLAESTKDYRNIANSEVTLLVTTDADSVKCRSIQRRCNIVGKECYIYDINEDMSISLFRPILDYKVINVTGDPESQSPGIKNLTTVLVKALLTINELLITHENEIN